LVSPKEIYNDKTCKLKYLIGIVLFLTLNICFAVSYFFTLQNEPKSVSYSALFVTDSYYLLKRVMINYKYLL